MTYTQRQNQRRENERDNGLDRRRISRDSKENIANSISKMDENPQKDALEDIFEVLTGESVGKYSEESE
jgi:hypothetical protein